MELEVLKAVEVLRVVELKGVELKAVKREVPKAVELGQQVEVLKAVEQVEMLKAVEQE